MRELTGSGCGEPSVRLRSPQRCTNSGNIKQNKTKRSGPSPESASPQNEGTHTAARKVCVCAKRRASTAAPTSACANYLAQSRVENLRMRITPLRFTSGRFRRIFITYNACASLGPHAHCSLPASVARSGWRYRTEPGRVGVGRAAAMVFYFTSSGESAAGGGWIQASP